MNREGLIPYTVLQPATWQVPAAISAIVIRRRALGCWPALLRPRNIPDPSKRRLASSRGWAARKNPSKRYSFFLFLTASLVLSRFIANCPIWFHGWRIDLILSCPTGRNKQNQSGTNSITGLDFSQARVKEERRVKTSMVPEPQNFSYIRTWNIKVLVGGCLLFAATIVGEIDCHLGAKISSRFAKVAVVANSTAHWQNWT